MIAAALEPQGWTRRRWWLLLALVLAGQLGLVFWLSDRAPLRVRPPAAAPTLRFAGKASAELLALTDPTLFALPHRQGFAGPAWVAAPAREFHASDQPESPDWLALPLQRLGASFSWFVATNQFQFLVVRPEPEPELALPALAAPTVARGQSSLRLEWDLTPRHLISRFELPVWAHTNLLTSSVVQMTVDADGRTVSPGTLLSSSGYPAADQLALDLVRKARFESLSASGPGRTSDSAVPLTWGKMIFEWQTVPATNTPAANSPSAALPP